MQVVACVTSIPLFMRHPDKPLPLPTPHQVGVSACLCSLCIWEGANNLKTERPSALLHAFGTQHASILYSATITIHDVKVPAIQLLPSDMQVALLAAVTLTQLSGQMLLNRGFMLMSATRGSAINVMQVTCKLVCVCVCVCVCGHGHVCGRGRKCGWVWAWVWVWCGCG